MLFLPTGTLLFLLLFIGRTPSLTYALPPSLSPSLGGSPSLPPLSLSLRCSTSSPRYVGKRHIRHISCVCVCARYIAYLVCVCVCVCAQDMLHPTWSPGISCTQTRTASPDMNDSPMKKKHKNNHITCPGFTHAHTHEYSVLRQAHAHTPEICDRMCVHVASSE